MPTKFCKLCKTDKELSEFHPRTRQGKAIGHLHPCKICWNIKRKKHWQENKKSILARHTQIRIENKRKAIEYLGGKCVDCKGVFHMAAFDFHHLEGKDSDIGSLLMYKFDNIKKELTKCVLLCANCHRIRHHTHFN